MSGWRSSQKTSRWHSIPKIFALGALASCAVFGAAAAAEPVVQNGLVGDPNPTATVSKVCDKLGSSDYDYPMTVHTTCFSEQNKSVVVLVSGKVEGMSGEAIATHIVGKLAEDYVPAVGFLDMPELDGVSIVYFLNGDYYGPYSGDDWKVGLEIITIHSAQAWYQ